MSKEILVEAAKPFLNVEKLLLSYEKGNLVELTNYLLAANTLLFVLVERQKDLLLSTQNDSKDQPETQYVDHGGA